MKISRPMLEQAVAEHILDARQADRLWSFLEGRTAHQPGFRPTHILYYLGGMIAIGAMTLFMTLGWERFGGWGLFGIALAYAAAGLVLTEHFLGRDLPIPGGITAAFVAALTPLAIYGLQSAFGLWADGLAYRDYHRLIDWRWMMMEFATLATGAVLLWRYRLPFLVMPVAVTLWYMSMDLTPFLFGDADRSWDLRKFVSMWFGLLMILLALWVELRTRSDRDYAFWLYLFGVIAFWGGLSLQESGSEWGKFLYFCVNLGMLGVGAVLARKVFAVFGAIGAAGYLGHLAHNVFADSMVFPFALTAIGLGVIYLGIVWQRHEAGITARLRAALPAPMAALLARRHG